MGTIKVSIFVDRESRTAAVNLEKNSLVLDLLKKLNINPVTVIVSRNGELILEDQELNDKDEIKILSVISGG